MIKVGLIGYGKYGKKYYTNIINDKKFKIIKILKRKRQVQNYLQIIKINFNNKKNRLIYNCISDLYSF